jgi:hypothetical protein
LDFGSAGNAFRIMKTLKLQLDFGSIGKAFHIWKTLKTTFGFWLSWKSITHLENSKNYIWILAQLERHYTFGKL